MYTENAPHTPSPQQPTPQPPQILRIKRKRGQDPLQALILEDTRNVKRSKPSTPITSPIATPRSQTPSHQRQLNEESSGTNNDKLNYMFKLAKTEISNGAEFDESLLHTILAEAAAPTEAKAEGSTSGGHNQSEIKRRFIIQPDESRRQSGIDYNDIDNPIPDQLSNMVEDLVSRGNEKPKSKRKRRGRVANIKDESATVADEKLLELRDSISQDTLHTDTIQTPTGIDDENQYVYDVYQLTDAEPLTTANHPSAQIGYIRFFDDDDNNNDSILDSTQQDLDETKKPSVLTDDEDSNAESFYQNDYPSDEDAGGLQELNSFEDEFDKLNLGDGSNNGECRGGHGEGNHDGDDDAYVPHDGIGWDGEEYFDYGDVERYMGLDEVDDDDDDDEDDEDDEIHRNQFFKSDADDPLALHRDKIFGKLEKMINKQ